MASAAAEPFGRGFLALVRLVLLGLAMMTLPVLLPFVAGRGLFSRRRKTPVYF